MGRIKVLFIHSALVCGGAEQALYDLVCLMDKSKFDITVLTLYEGGEWDEKFQKAGINVESVWSCQKRSLNPIVKFENWLKRKKIKESLRNDGKRLLEARKTLDYDIVVAYKMGSKQSACFIHNAKTVKFIHGNVNTNAEYREEILNTLETIKQFDSIICVSNESRIAIQELTGIAEVKTCFNPLNDKNVISLSQEEIDFECQEPIVCAVGRLSPEKGFERLIRIHKRIYDDGYKHKLVIVGDGPQRELLENIIRSIHCEESVVFVGYTSNPYPYMRKAAFLVCSSYTEALPVIAMESFTLGIPVVSAVPSIGELFGDEVCGIITDNDDASLEEGIRRMLIDSEFFEISKAGAERRSKFFDGKRMVTEIEKEFTRLVNA